MCNTLVHFMINCHRFLWFRVVEYISVGNNWITKASKIKIGVFKQKCPVVLSQFVLVLLGRIAPHQTRPYRPSDDLPDDQKSNSVSSRLPKYHPPPMSWQTASKLGVARRISGLILIWAQFRFNWDSFCRIVPVDVLRLQALVLRTNYNWAS